MAYTMRGRKFISVQKERVDGTRICKSAATALDAQLRSMTKGGKRECGFMINASAAPGAVTRARRRGRRLRSRPVGKLNKNVALDGRGSHSNAAWRP